MLVEFLVLGRQNGFDQQLGDGLNRDKDAFLPGKLGQQPSIARMHPGHHRRFVIGKLLIIGQPLAIMPVNADDRADPQHGHQREDRRQGRKNAQQTPHRETPSTQITPARPCPASRSGYLPETLPRVIDAIDALYGKIWQIYGFLAVNRSLTKTSDQRESACRFSK